MSIRKHSKLRIIYWMIVCVFMVYFWLNRDQWDYDDGCRRSSQIIADHRPNGTDGKKYILFYLQPSEYEIWRTGPGVDQLTLDEKFLENYKCSVSSCVFTRNKTLLNSVALFDAIVFDIVGPRRNFQPPQYGHPNQIYIASGKESPQHFHRNIRKDNSTFNLIMNYRLDADIVWVHGSVEDVQTGRLIAPHLNPLWLTPPQHFGNRGYFNRAREKKGLVAWMASNCETPSKREELIRQLMMYIHIDVFGACASHYGQENNTPLCPRDEFYAEDSCNDLFDKKYKFYLAFENSLCEDYVTEKLYRTMTLLIVPVVYGGANYTRFAPPGSYIDANAFPNLESLARYLLHLDQHPEEYIRYFWWKKHYHINISNIISYCDLCKKVHQESQKEHLSLYEKLEDWWLKGCTRPKIKF